MKKINNEQEYKRALTRLSIIFNFPEGTKEFDEASELEIAIEEYESIHHPIDGPVHGLFIQIRLWISEILIGWALSVIPKKTKECILLSEFVKEYNEYVISKSEKS